MSTAFFNRMRRFAEDDAAGGIVIIAATVLALIVANSPAAGFYDFVLKDRHLAHWINDGLMAIFFFVVGLEIKREMREGALSTLPSAVLPAIAAVGGVAVPAAIYWLINRHDPASLDGWAIPTATDIAFSLGLLALIAPGVPREMKILLSAIAIIDDLIAILIIALFYAGSINAPALAAAAALVAVMVAMNRCHVTRVPFYIAAGAALWGALLYSGIHPTLAGVATAALMPIRKLEDGEDNFQHLIHLLHPYTAFIVLPLFAFANAGIAFNGVTARDFTAPLTTGIAAGLVIGKAVGITGMLALLYRLPFIEHPAALKYRHLLALGFLCGIGFTMSLFIGDLAFASDDTHLRVRLGVIGGSCLSALCAALILRLPRSAAMEGQAK